MDGWKGKMGEGTCLAGVLKVGPNLIIKEIINREGILHLLCLNRLVRTGPGL
jgi:hypothetical protein